MVELRWAIPASTTTERPRLQYRQLPSIVTFGAGGWSEWQDVPYVVVPAEPPKPAPTVLMAIAGSASEPCPACKGTGMGRYNGRDYEACPKCDGTRFVSGARP